MARNIIKSNNVAVAVQNGTNFSTTNLTIDLYTLVQGYNYSVQFSHQGLKQVGSQDLVSNKTMQQPDVTLGFSYIPEPTMYNEAYGLFTPRSLPINNFINMFSGALELDTNFYLLICPNQEDDALTQMSFDETPMDLTGWDAIAFGNCFPTTYGLTYGVGTLPIVSTTYICSNVVFENLTGTSMVMPAVDLTGGNNDNVGRCLFQIDGDHTNPPIVNPTDAQSSVTLQNLQVGGQPISGTHFIQAVDMSVDLPRVSNYGLGNDFAYGRKAQLPANGKFSVSSLVSGLEGGILTGVLGSESDYDFQLVLASGSQKMIYQVEDAKLTSYSYSMPVNNQMTFDAEFSFEITETKGLKLSGTAY